MIGPSWDGMAMVPLTFSSECVTVYEDNLSKSGSAGAQRGKSCATSWAKNWTGQRMGGQAKEGYEGEAIPAPGESDAKAAEDVASGKRPCHCPLISLPPS